MNDDDWDLQAVVRGCAGNTSAATHSTHFPSDQDPTSFVFSGNIVDDRNHPFHQGLNVVEELCVEDPPPAAAAPMHRPPLQLNMQFNNNIGSPPQNLVASIPQPIRPRRRKNQQMKMVRQMTQEELSADSWAWRKYGQKPIKGSPYPRNYYRCSTSKGCAARKQVERSPNDPEIFVVSYSGDHSHPRPTHRSSLAGSTRTKLPSTPPILSHQKDLLPSSSSTSSFTPATPSMEGDAADVVHMVEEDDYENVMMSPNDLMNDDDDVLRAFQDSDDHSSGDLFSSGVLSSPPWTPTSSAATFSG